MGMLLAVLAVALVGGGAAFIFKVLRPENSRKPPNPRRTMAGELDDYDGPDGYGDEDDDGPPWDEEDDAGEEADK